jgi:Tfp pilus assembly protein PilW
VKARPAAGFTLVEVMISLGLTLLVMALTLPFVHVQKRLWERQEDEREAGRALTAALAWITRDLQQAGYHVPGPPLRRLEDAALAYVLSRDEDDPAGFRADNQRLITVFLDGGDLKYRIQAPAAPPATGWESGSTQVLASGISGMRCRGVDAAGAATTDPAAAAFVACAMTAGNGAVSATGVRLRTAAGEAAP